MTSVSDLSTETFAGIVGPANVRIASADDEVQGVAPTLVVAPRSEDEASAVLREASGRRLRMVIRGAGTKQAWGAPPAACDVILSTHHLDELLEHAPGDLVCVAQAGMQLQALQSALSGASGHAQKLMLDAPTGGTVGGIVATAASGPLRSRYGTPRDLVIGVRFVLADGTVGHAGGKVVKNVAGYDMGKLLTGSLGTLALITQVAFRLHPDPPASRTVVFDGDTAGSVVGFLDRLRSVPVAVTCADVLWPDAVVRVRIDGPSDAVEQQAQSVRISAGGRVVDDAEAALVDRRVAVGPWNSEGAVAGVAVPRTGIRELMDIASRHTQELVLRGLLGTGEARLEEDAALVTRFRTAVAALGGHIVLHRAQRSLGAVAWPSGDPVAVDLMRSVKRALDPAGVLGRGRFMAGI